MMDAKLIEDARAWRADRVYLMTHRPASVEAWITSNEEAFAILARLAELPLEGDDL